MAPVKAPVKGGRTLRKSYSVDAVEGLHEDNHENKKVPARITYMQAKILLARWLQQWFKAVGHKELAVSNLYFRLCL